MALLLVVSLAGCGSDNGGGSPGPASVPGSVCVGTGCVSLGSTVTAGDLSAAGSYGILAKTGISNTGTSAITGNIGISPSGASSITGFGLVADATNVFSTSSLVTGKIYASNYAVPTPANLTAAVLNMETAYTTAAGRPAGVGASNLNVGGGTLSGLNFAPGTYTWNTPGNVSITGDITLTGTSTDVWIFQITGNLTMAGAKNVILSGGALPQNVFWQVAGGAGVSIGAGSHFEGIILAQTQITLLTGASLKGRALAQSAVTLQGNAITVP